MANDKRNNTAAQAQRAADWILGNRTGRGE